MNTTPRRPAPRYPETRKDGTVDDYFCTLVPDPYRWLEDDNSDETKAWVAAQNRVTEEWLAGLPSRERFRKRLEGLWNHEKYGLPVARGGRRFWRYNPGLLDQALLMVAEGGEAERVLFDPNSLSTGGTVALNSWSPTDDGNLVALVLSEAGSDWATVRVREVGTGEDLADEVRWLKNSGVSWLKDGSGFYYARNDAPAEGAAFTAVNKTRRLFFHRLGTDQAADELVYERPDQPEWYLGCEVSEDGDWLVIRASHGTRPETRLWTRDLRVPGAPIVPLLEKMDAIYWPIGNLGETFCVLTNRGAPRLRVVAIDRSRPEEAAWREVIPEGPGRAVLDGATMVGGRIVCHWLRDVASALTLHALDGTLVAEPELPGLGSVALVEGRPSERDAYFSFSSFDNPGAVYRLDAASGEVAVWRAPRVDFPFDSLVVEREFYATKDGTRIPIFLVHKKGLAKNGSNPARLYGYGGFNISMTPAFAASILPWLEAGGIFAVACIRGGGEYGKEWNEAGKLDKKQNVFDDFIAAAEWLISEGWTSSPKLAIEGGSNGGLLVGACMCQRPELFAAAVPAVGVMDMLRFHKFTVGWGWTSDYGSSETEEGFRTLMRYSPLHNLKAGVAYPATLVLTGDHDDRVVPAHSHKFTATLQERHGGTTPVLTRIETDAGHGLGKPLSKLVAEAADKLAFLADALGMEA